MSAVSLTSAKGYSAGSSEKVAPREGFLTRLYAAIVSAQMARAEREVAFYIQRTGIDPRK